MAITIQLFDADNDGTGIDLAGYLGDYDTNFSLGYWGHFNDPGAGMFEGSEFALSESTQSDLSTPIGSAYQSVIVESGSSADLEYDFGSHVLAGSVESVTFGHGLSYDSGNDSFSNTPDIEITGLDVTGAGSGNPVHALIYGLMTGDTTALQGELASEDVTYLSSDGDDVMYGFGGDDTFVFETGSSDDTVYFFGASGTDVLDVSGWGVTEFADLTIDDSGSDTLIEYGGDSILLVGVDSVTASDFAFAPALMSQPEDLLAA